MFTTVKLGKTNFEELSGALFNVAPIAAASGVSMKEVAAATAALTAQGVPTSVATTQIRSAIQSLTAPTRRTAKVAKELGLNFSKAHLEEVGFAEAMREVTEVAGDDLEILRRLLGSTEAVQATLALGGEQAGKFTDALTAMETAGGAVDEAFGTMAETTSFKLNKAFNKIKITIVEKVLAALPAMVEFFENKVMPAFQAFGAWFRDNKAQIAKFFIDAWSVIQPILRSFWEGLGVVLRGWKVILAWLERNRPILIAVILAIGAAIVLALGPASTALLAVAAIITLIGQFNNIAEAVTRIWGRIKDFFSGLWRSVVGVFKNHWDKILAILLPIPGIYVLIARNWGKIKGVVGDVFRGVWHKIRGWLQKAIDLIESLPGIVAKAIKGIPARIGGALNPVSAIGGILGLQHGGIVRDPTIALIGEAGPEAVIPLSWLSSPRAERLWDAQGRPLWESEDRTGRRDVGGADAALQAQHRAALRGDPNAATGALLQRFGPDRGHADPTDPMAAFLKRFNPRKLDPMAAFFDRFTRSIKGSSDALMGATEEGRTWLEVLGEKKIRADLIGDIQSFVALLGDQVGPGLSKWVDDLIALDTPIDELRSALSGLRTVWGDVANAAEEAARRTQEAAVKAANAARETAARVADAVKQVGGTIMDTIRQNLRSGILAIDPETGQIVPGARARPGQFLPLTEGQKAAGFWRSADGAIRDAIGRTLTQIADDMNAFGVRLLASGNIVPQDVQLPGVGALYGLGLDLPDEEPRARVTVEMKDGTEDLVKVTVDDGFGGGDALLDGEG